MTLYDVCMLRVLKAELCCCVSVTYHAVLIIKTVFVFSLELLQIGDEDGIPAEERKVMANGIIGRLTEFDSSEEQISSYIERAQLFFDANGIEEDKKVAVFLSSIGAKTYALLRNLVAPKLPTELKFEEVTATLKQHFEPRPLVIAERYYFHRRHQAAGETVGEFVAELRRLSTHCQFGSYLEEVLRDRFVCGLRNEPMVKRLLTEADLTFKRAVEIAQGMEAAAENARKLQSPTSSSTNDHTQSAPSGQRDVCKIYTSGQTDTTRRCYRCGQVNHEAKQCPFKTAQCHNCGKLGHIRRACRQPKKPRRSQPVQFVQRVTDSETDPICVVYQVGDNSTDSWKVDVEIDGKPLRMEVDTGAKVSLVSEKTYRSLFGDAPLQKASTNLCTYSGERLAVLGKKMVTVTHNSRSVKLPLVIVKEDGPSLFGYGWLKEIQLDWKTVFQIGKPKLHEVLRQYEEVFKPELGTLQGYEAKIYVEQQATPRYCKARNVPYALREKVELELDRLTQEGVIEPIQFSDWAAPIVPVLKSDGESIRICGDFKVTVNQVSKLDQYPIPKIEDLFTKLAGGKTFTKLDMSQAYQQLVLDKESRKYVVINTHRGLFRYNRLPFGVSSAPGIFQRTMENLLQGIPGVVVAIY